jgi:hypothetical protein
MALVEGVVDRLRNRTGHTRDLKTNLGKVEPARNRVEFERPPHVYAAKVAYDLKEANQSPGGMAEQFQTHFNFLVELAHTSIRSSHIRLGIGKVRHHTLQP